MSIYSINDIGDLIDFENIHAGGRDVIEIYYGDMLIWEYISSNIVSMDDMILMSSDGYVIDCKEA